MPKVGNKDFKYSSSGMAAARAYAKETGKKVKVKGKTKKTKKVKRKTK
jgi:hypothetical protein